MRNALCGDQYWGGITLIGELVQMSEERLMREPNIGPASVAQLKKTLSEFGLSLGMEIPGWDAVVDRRQDEIK
jgi:DNA-directed RNA polymerase alpha subunit